MVRCGSVGWWTYVLSFLLPVATGCCTLSWREVGGKITEACGGQLEPNFREVRLYKLLFRAAQFVIGRVTRNFGVVEEVDKLFGSYASLVL